MRTAVKIFGCLALSALGVILVQTPARAQAGAEPEPLAPLKIVLAGDSTVASGGGWGTGKSVNT